MRGKGIPKVSSRSRLLLYKSRLVLARLGSEKRLEVGLPLGLYVNSDHRNGGAFWHVETHTLTAKYLYLENVFLFIEWC